MKKLSLRSTAFLLLLILLSSLLPTAAAADRVSAKGGSINITFNGTAMKLGTYNIANNNYVKLRDVAQLLKGTGKEFSVTWNGGAQRIDLASGEPYITEGGELGAVAAGERSAAASTASVWLDGVPVTLEAYTIDSNNFFKLRDLGAALDFCVDWDGGVIVDTSRGYSGAAPSVPSAPSASGAAAYSDAQLLALAQEAAEDIPEMAFFLDCYGILDYSETETISAVPFGGSPDYPWTYYRVPGYTSMTEILPAIEKAWYQKFSRKYDSLDWLGHGGNLDIYLAQDGKIYVQDGALGMGPFTYVIDRMVSRTENEAVFAGRTLMYDTEETSALELSLVYEDGTWKYGYFSSESNPWANPNAPDDQLLWMAENAAERMFDWRLDAELGWFFSRDWENYIEYSNWYYSKVIGYSTAAQARATMEEEWYRHFSRRYTIEQVMGENSNFTNPYMPYFADLADGVYMPECQWGGSVLSFTDTQLVSRTADEAVFRASGYDREFPDEGWQVPVEFSLVFEGGVWKYGYYKDLS